MPRAGGKTDIQDGDYTPANGVLCVMETFGYWNEADVWVEEEEEFCEEVMANEYVYGNGYFVKLMRAVNVKAEDVGVLQAPGPGVFCEGEKVPEWESMGMSECSRSCKGKQYKQYVCAGVRHFRLDTNQINDF